MVLQVDPIQQEDSLVEMIQKILGSGSEDFTEDTILGSDINRIRHLFYNLESEKKTVMLQYSSEIFKSKISHVDGNKAWIEIPGFEPEAVRRCRIKFEIANILYEFEVPILEFVENGFVIRIPSFLQSASRRGDRRLYVEDLFMRFIIIYTPLFGRRGIGQRIESNFPFIIKEIEKDEPDLFMLNIIITEQIRKISETYDIVFYQPGRKKDLMEVLIEQSGKTLFIQDTNNLESYFISHMPYGMINYHAEYAHIMRYDSEENAARQFEERKKADRQKFLTSYICAPIMIFDTVIGHIYVSRSVFERLRLTEENAFQIHLLANLLSYAMSKTVLARSYFRHTYSRILNISRSGLLFELNNRIVFDYLTYHDRLKMEFNIRHHQLSFKGAISRFAASKNGFNIGVQFFGANPDDYIIIENFIYQRQKNVFG